MTAKGHVRKPQEIIQRMFPTLRVEEPEVVAMEVYRGVDRCPNPVPALNPGGDCFACAVFAGVQHLFPEKALRFDEMYACWTNPVFPKQKDNTWDKVLDVIDRISDTFKLPLERGILFTPPYSGWDVARWEPSWFRPNNAQRWWRDLNAYLAAGWLAIAHVNQYGEGPYVFQPGDEEGFVRSTNHVVLLDGVRQVKRTRKFPDGGSYSSWDYEVHVVDSSQSDSTGWHSLHGWLFRHGASALHIIRRHDRPDCVGMMGPPYSIA